MLGSRGNLQGLDEPFLTHGAARFNRNELRAHHARRPPRRARRRARRVAGAHQVGDAGAQLRRRPRAARLGGGGEEVIRQTGCVFGVVGELDVGSVFRAARVETWTRDATHAVVQRAPCGRRERRRRQRREVRRGGDDDVFFSRSVGVFGASRGAALAALAVRVRLAVVVVGVIETGTVVVCLVGHLRKRRRHRRVQRGQHERKRLSRARRSRRRRRRRLGVALGFPPRRRLRFRALGARQAAQRVVPRLRRRHRRGVRVRRPRERSLLAPRRLLGLRGGRRDGVLERLEPARGGGVARRRVRHGGAQLANALVFRLLLFDRLSKRHRERVRVRFRGCQRTQRRLQARLRGCQNIARLAQIASRRLERRRRDARLAARRFDFETHRLRGRRCRLRRGSASSKVVRDSRERVPQRVRAFRSLRGRARGRREFRLELGDAIGERAGRLLQPLRLRRRRRRARVGVGDGGVAARLGDARALRGRRRLRVRRVDGALSGLRALPERRELSHRLVARAARLVGARRRRRRLGAKRLGARLELSAHRQSSVQVRLLLRGVVQAARERVRGGRALRRERLRRGGVHHHVAVVVSGQREIDGVRARPGLLRRRRLQRVPRARQRARHRALDAGGAFSRGFARLGCFRAHPRHLRVAHGPRRKARAEHGDLLSQRLQLAAGGVGDAFERSLRLRQAPRRLSLPLLGVVRAFRVRGGVRGERRGGPTRVVRAFRFVFRRGFERRASRVAFRA